MCFHLTYQSVNFFQISIFVGHFNKYSSVFNCTKIIEKYKSNWTMDTDVSQITRSVNVFVSLKLYIKFEITTRQGVPSHSEFSGIYVTHFGISNAIIYRKLFFKKKINTKTIATIVGRILMILNDLWSENQNLCFGKVDQPPQVVGGLFENNEFDCPITTLWSDKIIKIPPLIAAAEFEHFVLFNGLKLFYQR